MMSRELHMVYCMLAYSLIKLLFAGTLFERKLFGSDHCHSVCDKIQNMLEICSFGHFICTLARHSHQLITCAHKHPLIVMEREGETARAYMCTQATIAITGERGRDCPCTHVHGEREGERLSVPTCAHKHPYASIFQ